MVGKNMVGNINLDIIESSKVLDFPEIVKQGKTVEIIYNPDTRVITVRCDNKEIEPREVHIILTSHTGSQINIRLQDDSVIQLNGLDMVQWNDYIIKNPLVYVMLQVKPKT